MILNTPFYSICKGREILPRAISSRYIQDLHTCYYLCKWSKFFTVYITGPQQTDEGESLTTQLYNERVRAINYTIEIQFLEENRKRRNYLPHLQFPSTPPSPTLSNLINFTNSESVYPIEPGDSWRYISASVRQ